MHPQSHHDHLARCGATTVELAFVLPIFLLIFVGIVEIGRAFMASHLLTNAARTSCRVGILPNKNVSDMKKAVADTMAHQGVSNYTTTVTVNGVKADDSTVIAAASEIAVSVTVPVHSICWLPRNRFLEGNITGQFSLARE